MPGVDFNPTLTDISVPSTAEPDELCKYLDMYGAVVVPSAINTAELELLCDEYDRMMSNPELITSRVDEKPNFKNLRLKLPDVPESDFPATKRLFSQSWMGVVAEKFFDSTEYRLNGEIFVSQSGETNDDMMNAPPFALHFDKRQVLKFFYYLSDTDVRNGALRLSPGSHTAIRNFRVAEMTAGRPLPEIPNVVENAVQTPFFVEEAAGSLIIFTTDVAHGHSSVQPGHVRKVMRGHTHSHDILKAMGVM